MSVDEAFARLTGRPAAGTWSAPGRVNLIGEHTDYNDGYVLPFALALRTTVAAARRDDGRLVMRSLQRPDETAEVPVADLAPGRPGGWAGYVAGVVWALREAGYPVGGLDVVVDGGVPPGAGLSSSAALECATALAAADLYGLDIEPAGLARLAQRAENGFVGVPSGSMDQTVALLATAGHALFLDTRTGATEQVPFDPAGAGFAVLVIDTRVHHRLADGGGYADRRRACEDAARRLGVPALRDIGPMELRDAVAALADEPVLARRVRHVVTENTRVRMAVALLRAGRYAALGRLLTDSHRSLRDHFEVSVAELDTAVDAALEAGAVGARLTGGGFGGCALALTPLDAVPAVEEAVRAAAGRRKFVSPTVRSAVPSAGASRDPAAPARPSVEGTPAWQR